MKLYCTKNNEIEISDINVCVLRSKNKNLSKCYGCLGATPKIQDEISQCVVALLDKEEPHPPGTVFRVKHHKKYLTRKYGKDFYNRLCAQPC